MRASSIPSWQILLLAGGVVVTLATGIRQVSGLFLRPVAAELGMSLEAFGTVVAVQNLVWGLSQPLAGLLADRHGAGRVALVCGLLYAAGLALAAAASTPFLFSLGLGALCGLGQAGTTYAVVLAAIGRAAPAESRGLALGLGSAAGSVGMFVLVPATGLALDALGWRGAMAALAGLMLLAPLLALALREAPAEVGARGSPREALRAAVADRDFWLLNFGFATCGFQLAFLATYLPAILVERGLGLGAGAAALAAIGLANILGTWAAGVAGDRWPKARVLVGVYLARAAVVLAFLALPPSTASAAAFGAAIGLLWTGTVPLTSGLVAALWGRRNLGFLFGLVYVGHQLGAFAGAWAGGAIYDRTGGFAAGWALVIGASLSAALCHLILRERPRSIALAEAGA